MVMIPGHIIYDGCGIILAVAVIIVVYCKWSFQYWKHRNINYLEPSVPWGNLVAPYRRKISSGEEITEIYNKAKEKGWKYVGFYSMTSPIFMPLDLDIIKCILTKDFNYFIDRGIHCDEGDDSITANLFTIGGEKWKNLRMKVSPNFRPIKLRQMFQTIANYGTKLENFLINEALDNEPVDIREVLGHFTTDIIGSCCFGMEFNSFEDPTNPMRINVIFPKFSNFLRLRVLDGELEGFFNKVIQETIQYRKNNKTDRHDLLQILIDHQDYDLTQPGDGNKFTLNEIIANCFAIFGGGFETSSTTMTYALFELSRHQDIQDKLRKEIQHVLKQHNGELTYDAVYDMKYLDQVIDEALRLYPPIPIITRNCGRDYVVPNTDVKIEKGQVIFIPVKGLHYDEDYYENAYQFNPDRFSEENKRNRNQYSFLSFGEGPRICVAMRFGILKTKVGIINTLKKFRIILNKKTTVPLKFKVNSFIPQVEGEIWLDLQRI